MKKFKFAAWLLILLASCAHADDALVDPTRPPDFSSGAQAKQIDGESFVLNAVYIFPSRRFAIINHQQVVVGDKLGEFTITSITPFTVELLGPNNKRQVLQLAVSVKQPR